MSYAVPNYCTKNTFVILKDFDEYFLAHTLVLTIHLINVIKVLNLKIFQPGVDIIQPSCEEVPNTNTRDTILFGVYYIIYS